jgi:hypothetical protein
MGSLKWQSLASKNMTNKEKKERIQKEDGKAFETLNIETDVTYLNPKYTLSKQRANVMTGNGLLKVFELNPLEGGPSFIGRWDGGSRDPGKTERYDLDIDIYRVSREEKRRFNKGEPGYSGHHTTRVESERGYKYQVSLFTPDEKIFEGTVCFNLHRKIGVSDEISARDRATAVVTRGRSPRPAAPLVDNFYDQTLRVGVVSTVVGFV